MHGEERREMSSESESLKNDISASTADTDNKESLLPENVKAELERGMKEGFKDDVLDLGYKLDIYFIFIICVNCFVYLK